jgi:hypothetical protein
MKKYVKLFVLVLFVALIILQFIKPDTVNPVEDNAGFVKAHLQIPDDVYSRIEKSCFDCHSFRTKWPWYSKISPVVYLLNKDVRDGRRHLNFSTWGDYSKAKMIDKLEEIVKEVNDGGMPLPIYLPLHPEAKMSENDKKILVDWAQTTKNQLLINK